MEPKRLSELARMVGGEFAGDCDPLIYGVGDLDNADAGQVAFVGKARQMAASSSKAEAFIVPLGMTDADRPVIRIVNPALALAIIHTAFLHKPFLASGLHPRAQVGADCLIPEAVAVAPGVVIGDRVTLGERVSLGAGTVVGDDVTIGDDTVLHANVTVYAECRIGARVIIHSGAVIGADGFGYVTDAATGRHVKRPHVGAVRIDDDVEIGANTCVDRATMGTTRIRQGTKLDNLAHVAHNNDLGENCLVAGQCGLAGSVTLGNNVVMGGQAGIKDHVRLGDKSMVAAQAGVIADLAPGSVVSGMPAIPHRQWLKASVVFAELPGLLREITQLTQRVAELERHISDSDGDSK